VWAFGFGLHGPGQSYPAIYIAGYVNHVWGVWRSDDNAATWVNIGTWVLDKFDSIRTVAGDMNIYGRVYVGFDGSGYAYGEIQ
jgi:hypothetical protein